MPALNSIWNVVTVLEKQKFELVVVPEIKQAIVETTFSDTLVESIKSTVFKLHKFLDELPPPLPADEEETENYQHLIEPIRRVSQNISENKRFLSFNVNGQESFLSFLGKENDENFHSDCLAAFLDPKKSGPLAFMLYAEILRFALKKEPVSENLINTRREVRLDALVPALLDSDLGARRIDILVQSNNYLLVIENKINSLELNFQTSDYHEAVKAYNGSLLPNKQKHIVEILLSPTGLTADCSSFVSMSYFDLFEILVKVKDENKDAFNIQYMNLYLHSLYNSFYQKDVNYFTYLKKFWGNK